MRAVISTRYGNAGLKKVNLKKPTPKENEVLIKTKATTVTTGDWRIQTLSMPRGFKIIARILFGIRGPRKRVLGTRLSGEVEAVGKSVTKFKPGDSVIAIDVNGFGCHAEYKCEDENGLIALKPPKLSFEEAAAFSFGGITALYFLRDVGRISPGERILINGASGSVGAAAVQLAKSFGAEVTAVCSSAHESFVRSLGATQTIDYMKTDVTKNGETYDLILDTVGNLTFSKCKDLLTPGGRLLSISASLGELIKLPWINLTNSKKERAGVVHENLELLESLLVKMKRGEFKSVIDKTFPIERIDEAYSYVSKRHKKGDVVITV